MPVGRTSRRQCGDIAIRGAYSIRLGRIKINAGIGLTSLLGPWQPRGSKDQFGKAPERAQAPRPHLEHCIKADRISSSAIAIDLNARASHGGQWFPMQVRRVRDHLGHTSRRKFVHMVTIDKGVRDYLVRC
jgi:hypothetical protein